MSAGKAGEVRFERWPGGRQVLHAEQYIPVERSRLFPFFAEAENLARITPSSMGFEITSGRPIEMGEGTIIDYRIRVLGLPLRWRTLISRWNPPDEFVDEQLRGPYREWIHHHRFRDAPDGGTLMTDEVRFQLPFGLLGRVALPIVRHQLRGIFEYRRRVIEELGPSGLTARSRPAD